MTSRRSDRERALALLSVEIGILMEDHVQQAILSLPAGNRERRERFERLRLAGNDIAAMAAAAEALLRRG